MHNRNRDFHAVGGGGLNLFHLVAGTVIAWHFLLLQQGGSSTGHVILENRVRRYEGLVAVAELAGVVFAVDVVTGIVSGFRKRNPPRLPGAEVRNPYLRQTIFALV